MAGTKPPDTPQYLLENPRPWPFSRSEIMAGLRRLSDDPTLTVVEILDHEIPHQRPSVGRVRGLEVECTGEGGAQTFHLVLKEPLGTTRVGSAGVGLREVAVYRNLADQLPLKLPRLVASHPNGDWLVIELTPMTVDPKYWKADDYFLATRTLVHLHDRFWALGEDLTFYNWLARPLDSDFEIYIRAAAAGVEHLVNHPPPALLAWDPDFTHLIGQLVMQSDRIAGFLSQSPSTFLHGDYWPGNLQYNKEGDLVVYDWQLAGIGPCALDLVHFIQSSRWWFDPIPLSPQEITSYFREELARANGQSWDEPAWEALWDYSLLWIFIANWIDLLAAAPESLIETRLDQLEEVWLNPLKTAAFRQQIPGV